WLEVGAEVGFAGLGCLVLFYGLTVVRLWPLARGKGETPDPWVPVAARMVVAALVGFAVAAQFVSLRGLEVPFYVAVIGAAVLKLCSARVGEPWEGGEWGDEWVRPAEASPSWRA